MEDAKCDGTDDIDDDVDNDNTDDADDTVDRDDDGDTIDIAILDDADDIDNGPMDEAAEGRMVEIRDDDIEGSYEREREGVERREGGEYLADVVEGEGKERPCLEA